MVTWAEKSEIGRACIGSYGKEGTHSSTIFGAVECFVPSRKQLVVLIYLSRRDQPPHIGSCRTLPRCCASCVTKRLSPSSRAHEGLNKLDTIWLGASPKSPQRMQLFDSHPGVPQFLMMDAKRSTPAIPYHTRPYHSCGAAPTPGIGLWGLINPLV